MDRTDIKIIVQPVEKFRFRYKSEMMGTHGSLLGEREETSHKKEVPTVQLVNCPMKNAVIRCTLVTSDEERRFPHAHHLVRKNGNTDQDDPHDIDVSDENDYVAMFCNMGIIHTAKKNIKEEILRKRKVEIIEEKKRNNKPTTITTKEDMEMIMEAEKAQKWMNLNSVALCFQGFCYGENGMLYPITDKIYSRSINNLKSALTGELKICRIDKNVGSCEGNEEIWLLVEKVGKKNIKVKFYEVDKDDNVIWDAEGRFSELDVHHQYAIVFKTPPYKDLNITKTKEVYLKLERPSDGEVSNTLTFRYKPSDKILNRKRRRMSSSSSLEFGKKDPTPTLGNCMQFAETCMTLPDNISISAELKQMLDEDTGCDSEELRKYFSKSSLEEYLSLCNTSDPCLSPGLKVHGGGPSGSDTSQENFANDALRNVIQILKEAEANISKSTAVNKIKNLLQERTNYGDTPLHFSLRNEEYESVKCILCVLSCDPSFKSIINSQNSAGKTPLHLAVLQNQPEIVQALLKLGADPNKGDEDDASPLHNAVIVSANECIGVLLQSGVKLNLEAHTESGWSALHLAAKSGSLYAVHALVEAGADVNATDMSYGRTPLHIAVDSNHKHIVTYLLTKTKANVNLKNFGGNTALHSAVVKGGKCAEELITILKKHGADPALRNNTINRDDEDDYSNNALPRQVVADKSASEPTIKSENSDSEYDEPRVGESSFDLAKDHPKLTQLLQETPPVQPMEEELDLKEESEDEMMLQDRAMMMMTMSKPSPAPQSKRTVPLEHPVQTPLKVMTRIPLKQMTKKQQLRPQQQLTPKQQLTAKQELTPNQQLPPCQQNEGKLTDEHVKRVIGILDRTGGWERLANHTNHGSLVRLYRKMSSPSTALFGKIRLQNPDITVTQVKKYLIEVQAYEAANALENKYSL